MIKFLLRHILISELTFLIVLLTVSILTGWLPFILSVVALFTLWAWWLITSFIHDVKEELHKLKNP